MSISARPAATLVLVRDGDFGLEALLVKRPGTARFAAGAWVFPGGAVDPDDHRIGGPGLAAAGWGARMALPERQAYGYVAAAVRETWEETGILVGRARHDRPAMARLRRQLLARTITFPEAAAGLGYDLDPDALIYIAHWITPLGLPYRFDTRFFLAPLPLPASVELIGAELDDSRWIRPYEALDRNARGEMSMLPPTVRTLRGIAAFRTASEAVAALRDGPVPTNPRGTGSG